MILMMNWDQYLQSIGKVCSESSIHRSHRKSKYLKICVLTSIHIRLSEILKNGCR